MSKKDYIKLAAALLDVRRSVSGDNVAFLHSCDRHANAVADVLSEGGQFDRQRFLTACGM